jgi:hypothetical protein
VSYFCSPKNTALRVVVSFVSVYQSLPSCRLVMANLSAWPFHPQTGQLIPVYRDAYLRGDLTPANASAVEAYLDINPVLWRWQELAANPALTLKTPSWVFARLGMPQPAAPAAQPAPVAALPVEMLVPSVEAVRKASPWKSRIIRLGVATTLVAILGAEWFVSYGVATQKEQAKQGPVFKKTEHSMEDVSAQIEYK